MKERYIHIPSRQNSIRVRNAKAIESLDKVIANNNILIQQIIEAYITLPNKH